jgi:hypothetical protein
LIFWLNQKWVLAQDIMKLHMMIQHLLNWCNRNENSWHGLWNCFNLSWRGVHNL